MSKLVSKSEKKAAATLDEVSELIRQGKLSKLPSSLTLDLNTISKEQYWTLMELLRHRSYGGALLKRQHEIQNVVELRNLVNAGKFSQAESKLSREMSDDPELIVEKVRIHVFSGQYPEAIELALRCLEKPTLEMTTRGVLSQLAGHAFLELGELTTAKAYLDSALAIATSLGNPNGQISASLFLAKQSAFEDRFTEASHHTENARLMIIKANSNLRWLLGYFRTIAQIEAIHPDGLIQRARDLYLLGGRISHLLGDCLYEVRCRLEASLVSLKQLNEKEIAIVLNLAKHEPRLEESDLPLWIEAIENRSPSEKDPLTLKKLMIAADKREGEDGHPSFSHCVTRFEKASWAYDSVSAFLVDFLDESFLSLSRGSPTEKIIMTLAQAPDGKMGQEELFENVWKLKWNSERHLNTLKVAITRFNQNEHSLKILRENDQISLNLDGIIF